MLLYLKLAWSDAMDVRGSSGSLAGLPAVQGVLGRKVKASQQLGPVELQKSSQALEPLDTGARALLIIQRHLVRSKGILVA